MNTKAGSLQNQILSHIAAPPIVGKGATTLHYTDRKCYEVLEVSKDNKWCKVQRLEATADTSKPCGHGHQDWVLTPTDDIFELVYKWGQWRRVGTSIEFDPSIVERAAKDGFTYIGAWMHKNFKSIAADIWNGHPFPQKVVEGFTREVKTYDRFPIVFGIKDYYYDWSF